jgi:hypothetical protein
MKIPKEEPAKIGKPDVPQVPPSGHTYRIPVVRLLIQTCPGTTGQLPLFGPRVTLEINVLVVAAGVRLPKPTTGAAVALVGTKHPASDVVTNGHGDR